MADRAIQDALDQLRRAIGGARSELLVNSTTLRQTQAHALDEVRSWVYDAAQYLLGEGSDEASALAERVTEIDGAWLDDGDGDLALEYNIEDAMDNYTGDALDVIERDFSDLAEAVASDPLQGNGEGARLIREFAEALDG